MHRPPSSLCSVHVSSTRSACQWSINHNLGPLCPIRGCITGRLNLGEMDIEDEEYLEQIELIPPPVTAIVGLATHQGQVLEWDHEVALIGNKCPNPRIHVCESCDNPILVYGRLIPCKHVFCLSCAQTGGSFCAKCNEKVVRVEQAGVGTIFQCRRMECRRTYLSQRDLLAHLKHRHSKRHKANKV